MPPRLGAAEKRFPGLDFWMEMPQFRLSYTLSINVPGRPPGADTVITLHVAPGHWQVTALGVLCGGEMQTLMVPKGPQSQNHPLAGIPWDSRNSTLRTPDTRTRTLRNPTVRTQSQDPHLGPQNQGLKAKTPKP